MLDATMSAEYIRTRIVRLKVSGYRSLYDVELDELPDIVVFHGKNGTGKSNLMAVPGMVLRWLAIGSLLPPTTEAVQFSYQSMNQKYGIRPTDFSHGRAPEMLIELEVELGSAAGQLINRSSDSLGRLHIAIRLVDTGSTIKVGYELASIGEDSLIEIKSIDGAGLFDRLRHALERDRLLLHYPAYRSIGREPLNNPNEGLATTFQHRMFQVHIDSNIGQRRQLARLGRRLAQLGTFDSDADNIELSPAIDTEFNEHQLLVSVPGVGDVPLENLGTGQQQLIMMAADALVEQRPIIQFEEPEAHLHAELMEAFARFLRLEAETAGPESPIDQVWISTHNHAFAIAPEYFEVTHDAEHGTKVERRDRAFATHHFYEPGPLWEALRSFANSTSRETVVMHDGHGNSITAGEILDSMDGDRERANEFAAAATRTIVGRFRKQPVEAS